MPGFVPALPAYGRSAPCASYVPRLCIDQWDESGPDGTRWNALASDLVLMPCKRSISFSGRIAMTPVRFPGPPKTAHSRCDGSPGNSTKTNMPGEVVALSMSEAHQCAQPAGCARTRFAAQLIAHDLPLRRGRRGLSFGDPRVFRLRNVRGTSGTRAAPARRNGRGLFAAHGL